MAGAGKGNHVHKRGKVWYFRACVNGKRYNQSLNTANRAEAISRASKMYKAAVAEKFEVLEAVRPAPVPVVITIEELFMAYRRAWRDRYLTCGQPQESTIRASIAQMRNVVGKALDIEPGEVDRLSTDRLDYTLTDAYLARVLVPGLPEKERLRQRTTARSTLAQAKSVFSEWALVYYRRWGLALPAGLDEWMMYRPVSAPPQNYKMPALDLVERTEAAGAELEHTDPALYLVWILSYQCGLRAGESAAAHRDWLVVRRIEDQRRYFLDVQCHGADNRTKRDRKIRIRPETYDLFLNSAAVNGGYVLPGATLLARNNLVKRKFAGWMRSVGWGEYKKAAHELRKLCVSGWFTRYGLEVACTWSGDTPKTVVKWYAEFDPRRHPDPGADVDL